METKIRCTLSQAIIRYLQAQWISRDGVSHPFFAGMWGIFGHGNVTGLGQALEENREFPYYQARNEQGMVHAAVAFAKQSRRKKAFACTSSIGPGATNMITAAAGATINRLPVLLLPGDTFVRRTVGPVLQQLEHPSGQSFSVNDCFLPISRYWDRIQHPSQLLTSLPEAVRVLTDAAETGAVTLALPQDIQTWAYDFPLPFFQKKIHFIPRPLPDEIVLEEAVSLLLKSKTPLLIAGGGLLYSEAEKELRSFCEITGIAVAETQAGTGALPWNHSSQLGALGVTGTLAANLLAKEADVLLCVGTRLTDFTTASKTQFQNPHLKFLNINISAQDAHKNGGLPLVGDAKAILKRLKERLLQQGFQSSSSYREKVQHFKDSWEKERNKFLEGPNLSSSPGLLSQAQVLGKVLAQMGPQDTIVGAAGSLPGDMHKLLRCENGDQYHMEYGFSCMGYEVAGGLGAKMAKSQGEVFVMVGDGSFLMLPTEILTTLQENRKLIIVVIENHKFASIDGLSRSCGGLGFGNEFRQRHPATGELTGPYLPVDLGKLAEALGASIFKVPHGPGACELEKALRLARHETQTAVIVVEVDSSQKVPAFETWWDVPVAEVSQMESVQKARADYLIQSQKQKIFF